MLILSSPLVKLLNTATVAVNNYTLSLNINVYMYGLDITCNTTLSFALNTESFGSSESNMGFQFIVKMKNSGAKRTVTYPNNIVWTGEKPPMDVINNYYYVKFEAVDGVVSRATYLGYSN